MSRAKSKDWICPHCGARKRARSDYHLKGKCKMAVRLVAASIAASLLALSGCGPDACSRALDKCDIACPTDVADYCFSKCMAAEGDPCNAKDEETGQ